MDKFRRFLCRIGLHKFEAVLGEYQWPFGRAIEHFRCVRCGECMDIGGIDHDYD